VLSLKFNFDLLLTLDESDAVSSLQLQQRGAGEPPAAADGGWKPRIELLPVHDTAIIPLPQGKGVPYAGQPEVTERDAHAAALAAAAASGSSEDVAAAASAARALEQEKAAAPESFFQK
jgi:hypothetical protein